MDPSRNLKKNISRDTKPDSGRELTKSNLSSVRGPSEKEIRRLYRLKLNNPRISLDRQSGQAFLDLATFTKGHRLDFNSGKTVDRSILRRKLQESPGSVSTGESPTEKRGVGIFFWRGGSVSLDSPLVIWASCGVQVGLSHVVRISVGLDLYIGEPVFLQHVFNNPWCP